MESSFLKTRSEKYIQKVDDVMNRSVSEGFKLSWGAVVLILAIALAGWGLYSSIMFFVR